MPECGVSVHVSTVRLLLVDILSTGIAISSSIMSERVQLWGCVTLRDGVSVRVCAGVLAEVVRSDFTQSAQL